MTLNVVLTLPSGRVQQYRMSSQTPKDNSTECHHRHRRTTVKNVITDTEGQQLRMSSQTPKDNS